MFILQLKKGISIPEGSTIKIKSQGILGTVFLEIERSHENAPSLSPNSLIPKVSSGGDLSQVMNSAGEVADNLKEITASLKRVLATDKGERSLKEIIENIKGATHDIRGLISENRESLDEALQNIVHTIASLTEMVERNEGRVDDLLISLNEASQEFEAFGKNMNHITDESMRSKIQTIVNDVHDAVRTLKKSVENVDTIVADVEQGKGTVGKLLKDEETVNKINTALDGVNSILGPAQKLVVDFDYKLEVRNGDNFHSRYFGNHVNLFIRPNPSKYYILGFSDSQGGFKQERKRSVIRNDGDVTETYTEEFEPFRSSKLRINAQIGKRWDWLGLRFGIIESTAGVGGDIYLFEDHLTASRRIFPVWWICRFSGGIG